MTTHDDAAHVQVLSRAGRQQDAFLDLQRLKVVAPDTAGLLDMLSAAAAAILDNCSTGDRVSRMSAMVLLV